MRVLFCHDGPFSKDENGIYYGIAHNDEMFSRYNTIADEIRVSIRTKKVAYRDVYGKLSQITLNNLSVIECPNMSTIKGILFDKNTLKKILQNEIQEADFIVARLPSQIGNSAVEIAKSMGKPYLIEVVACPWDSFWNYSLKGKIIAPFMTFIMKHRVQSAPYVVYVTREFLQNRYPTSGRSINCSNVILAQFDDTVLKKRLEHILFTKTKLIIGTIASNNIRFKGQQYIIKALSKLKQKGITNYEYQLVGGGDQTYLKSIANKYDVSDEIKFIGAIPHKEVFNWLDNIDIYVQPSRQEGLPRALVEAMSRGCPSFGAKTGGIPELLEKEYIFSNTLHNIDEICAILSSFDTVKMKEQAQRNYAESKKYDINVINERRKMFFSEFKATHISK